jgi:small subunit ribosomal protein S21
MIIVVGNKNNIEGAIRNLRKKSQKEGIAKEARRRQAYEKPSERRKRRVKENIARKKKIRKGEYFN